MDFIIRKLVYVLRWQYVPDFSFTLSSMYFDRLSNDLGRILGMIILKDSQRGNVLLDNIKDLPNSALLRILSSPETFYRISSGTEINLQDIFFFLYDSIQAEKHRLGMKVDIDHGVWSALGDCYFPNVKFAHLKRETIESERSPNSIYQAPRLSHSIPVDYRSQFAKGYLPDITEPAIDFTTYELRRIFRSLNKAISEISYVNKCAGELIESFVKVIVLRKDPSINSFSSGSTRDYVGRVVLVNPHFADAPHLADALIHESIHSLLYIIELETPFILERDIALNFRLKSPWTGADLPLHSFIHACLVWFGLWQFWKLAFEMSAFPKQKISERIARSSSGFARDNLFDEVEKVMPVLSKDFEVILLSIKECISKEEKW